MAEQIWTLIRGNSPLVAIAPHDGHAIRDELIPYFAIDENLRLYEEDPFTAEWVKIAPTQIIGTRSRFEVDLNRPPERAIYLKPEQAWGLTVWKQTLPPEIVQRTMENYHAFYDMYLNILREIEAQFGYVIVYEFHSYNHRRDGANQPPAPEIGNPEINIGTSGNHSDYWHDVWQTFSDELKSFDYFGRSLDVREDIRFDGGPISRFVHRNFPHTGISINIEVKKFYMDEWTAQPNWEHINMLYKAFASTTEPMLNLMKHKFGR